MELSGHGDATQDAADDDRAERAPRTRPPALEACVVQAFRTRAPVHYVRPVRPRSLRAAAEESDAARFVGRDPEMATVADLLDADTPSRILFVHGPGGIGKSTLLRAAAALADRRGLRTSRIDARTLPPELEHAVEVVMSGGAVRRCVVIDEADALGPRLDVLRDRLLDELADTSCLLVAGRKGPSPSWRTAGLDAIVVGLPLRPLTDEDSAELLRSRGMDEAQVAEIVEWAQGSPLALTVAASAPAGRTDGPSSAALEQRLTQWLVGQPILDVSRDVLEVAALARTVDARLLSAALPGQATRDGLRRLAALPVVERLGDDIALHAVLAASIREHLRSTALARAAALSRRIAEHLATRARLGDMGALLRLSRLLESAELRAAIGNDPSDEYYADNRLHPGELERFGRHHGFDDGADWGEVLDWLQRPEGLLLIRRRDGEAVMVTRFVAVRELAHTAAPMRQPDPRRSHERDSGPAPGAIARSLALAAERTDADPARSFAGVVLFADGPARDAAEAARLGSGAFMLQHGVGDMQSMLIHYPEPDRRPPVPSSIASEVTGPLPRPVALSDFRPFGAIGNVEAMVLGELGFVPRSIDAGLLLAEDDDPVRIAALTARLDEVFGAGAEDRRQRRALELVHLGTRTSEEECLMALNVSRRTWFRILRAARERVAG